MILKVVDGIGKECKMMDIESEQFARDIGCKEKQKIAMMYVEKEKEGL